MHDHTRLGRHGVHQVCPADELGDEVRSQALEQIIRRVDLLDLPPPMKNRNSSEMTTVAGWSCVM